MRRCNAVAGAGLYTKLGSVSTKVSVKLETKHFAKPEILLASAALWAGLEQGTSRTKSAASKSSFYMISQQ